MWRKEKKKTRTTRIDEEKQARSTGDSAVSDKHDYEMPAGRDDDCEPDEGTPAGQDGDCEPCGPRRPVIWGTSSIIRHKTLERSIERLVRTTLLQSSSHRPTNIVR